MMMFTKARPRARLLESCVLALLLCCASGLAFPQAADAGRGLQRVQTSDGDSIDLYQGSYALLIGVSNYRYWRPLPSVQRELDQVEQVLRDQGFAITRVRDPDSAALRQALQDFVDAHGYDPGNRLLVYFAGHGHTWEARNLGYLVPVDAPRPQQPQGFPGPAFLKKALAMNQVQAWARTIAVRHALFLFDSCFSGTVFAARALPEAPPAITRLIKRPVREFITAGGADDTVPANSVFTPAFVYALRDGEGDLNQDGYITGAELGLYLEAEVPKYTRQTPRFGKIDDIDLARGDFVFVVAGAGDGRGSLDIVSDPAGATISIDGRRRGVAPLSVDGLQAGRVRVTAAKPGFVTTGKRVRIRAGRKLALNLSLAPTPTGGALRLDSEPSGAAWSLDGDYMGVTPDKAAGLTAGRHQVEVERRGYQVWRREVTIEAGGLARLQAVLTPEARDAALTVAAEPADARIRVMNIAARYRPGIRLPPGRYRLRVDRKGYTPYDRWI